MFLKWGGGKADMEFCSPSRADGQHHDSSRRVFLFVSFSCSLKISLEHVLFMVWPQKESCLNLETQGWFLVCWRERGQWLCVCVCVGGNAGFVCSEGPADGGLEGGSTHGGSSQKALSCTCGFSRRYFPVGPLMVEFLLS